MPNQDDVDLDSTFRQDALAILCALLIAGQSPFPTSGIQQIRTAFQLAETFDEEFTRIMKEKYS